jgi:hypothetical protein
MRAALDSNFPGVHKELSIAVHLTPWGGATIVPDATAFTPYVDRFHVMSFGKLTGDILILLYRTRPLADHVVFSIFFFIWQMLMERK